MERQGRIGGGMADKDKIYLLSGGCGEEGARAHVNKSYSIIRLNTKMKSSHSQVYLQVQGLSLFCPFLLHLCLHPTSQHLCLPRSILARLETSPSSVHWVAHYCQKGTD